MENEEKKIKISDLKNKYIFRTTGEEVEIVSFFKEKEGERSINDWISYIDPEGNEHYREHYNIDFDLKQTDKLDEYFKKLLDFPKPEPLKPLELPEMPTHEECLREQAAIAALQGILSNDIIYRKVLGIANNRNMEVGIGVANVAVSYADALIAELKKGE